MRAMLAIGSPAPSFSLPDADGKTVRLADLRGRYVVLFFYPKDDTPGCTVEACQFTEQHDAFATQRAVVLGCSGDDAASHRKFADKYRLKVTLMTDADRSVMKAYGAYGEKVLYGKRSIGVIRSTVVIDPDGNVAAHWRKVNADGHAAAVLAKLAELQDGAPAAPKRKVAKKVVAKPTAAKRAPAKKTLAKKPATKNPATMRNGVGRTARR
jgi:peroxiredoxin Q/BCP